MAEMTPAQQLAAARRVIVVQERSNPSTDFFLRPLLLNSRAEVVTRGFDQAVSAGELEGALVILVRYVPPAWRRQLEACRGLLAGLVYFMDDDILDIGASRGMPWRYRRKLARLGARHARWLRARRVQLWVSTPYLQHKYAEWHPRLAEPAPLPMPQQPVRLFYHGSASHADEIHWLRDVVGDVLAADERLSFEIIGGDAVRRHYAGLPRVTVVHPMPWDAYQHFLAQPGRHIGLAPMVENRFNRARSYTKFFDITAAGAVGLYPRGSVFEKLVQHGVNGKLLPMDKTAWSNAIMALATEPDQRQRMLGAAQQCCARAL